MKRRNALRGVASIGSLGLLPRLTSADPKDRDYEEYHGALVERYGEREADVIVKITKGVLESESNGKPERAYGKITERILEHQKTETISGEIRTVTDDLDAYERSRQEASSDA